MPFVKEGGKKIVPFVEGTGNPVFCEAQVKTSVLFPAKETLTYVFFKKPCRFTTYAYRVFVHNSVGFTPSREATVTTWAGLPRRGANVSVTALNRTALDVRWDRPSA